MTLEQEIDRRRQRATELLEKLGPASLEALAIAILETGFYNGERLTFECKKANIDLRYAAARATYTKERKLADAAMAKCGPGNPACSEHWGAYRAHESRSEDAYLASDIAYKELTDLYDTRRSA